MSDQTQPQLQVSPLSAWSEGELVQLPSKKVYRLRPVDALSVMGKDGGVPNFLLPLISKSTSAKSAQPAPQPTAEQMIKLAPMLNDIALASVVEPAIVSTPEEVRDGKGILLSMIPMLDKVAMLSYAMGGATAFEQVERFQPEQGPALDSLHEQKQRVTE